MIATTTADAPVGVPIYLRRDGDGYIVTDVIGKRYGWGHNFDAAIREWAEQVADILAIPDTGEPLRTEVARYRQALLQKDQSA